MTTELTNKPTTQDCQTFDRQDDAQILAEMEGQTHLLKKYVYVIKQGGREVSCLSYAGVKEVIRRRKNVTITSHQFLETEKTYRVIVQIHDGENNIDVLGAKEQEKHKPFAFEQCVNKAERNAFMKILPADFIASMINAYLKQEENIMHLNPDDITVTTPAPTAESQSEPEATPPATYNPKKTLADYKIPAKQAPAKVVEQYKRAEETWTKDTVATTTPNIQPPGNTEEQNQSFYGKETPKVRPDCLEHDKGAPQIPTAEDMKNPAKWCQIHNQPVVGGGCFCQICIDELREENET